MRKHRVKKLLSVILLSAMLVSSLLAFRVNADAPFSDVPNGTWYTDAVRFVAEKEYFSGTGNGCFSPQMQMTRAMFVTVLSKVSGDDTTECGNDTFSDVSSSDWYYRPIAWANAAGVASGVGDGIFAPNKSITRQEACLMMLKFFDHMKLTPRVVNEETVFADDAKIASWAKSGVYAIRSYGIISGRTGNIFDPTAVANRAEIAVMIKALDSDMEKAYKINVSTIDVKIDGLKKDYTFLQVSDTHITLTDETDDPKAIAHLKNRGDLFFADTPDRVPADKRFTDFVDYAKEQNVDLLAMTGDIIDGPSNGCLNFISDTLKNYGRESLFILGNHDWSDDWVKYQGNRSLYIPKFIEKNIISANEDYVAVREFDEFVIIAIDNSNDQINPQALGVLSGYIDERKPIILFLHVPIDTETLQDDTTAVWGRPILLGNPVLGPSLITNNFVKLVKSENSTVVAVFAGHIHFPHTDVINTHTGAKQYTLGASYYGDCAMVKLHG